MKTTLRMYTTVEVADMLMPYFPTANSVTIARWCDKGFIHGYRPGPRTRWMIPHASVVELFTRMGVPVEAYPGQEEVCDGVSVG